MTIDEMESAASDLLSRGSTGSSGGGFLNHTDLGGIYSDEELVRSHDEDELADEMTCVTSFWFSHRWSQSEIEWVKEEDSQGSKHRQATEVASDSVREAENWSCRLYKQGKSEVGYWKKKDHGFFEGIRMNSRETFFLTRNHVE